jgi:hypothetical protein
MRRSVIGTANMVRHDQAQHVASRETQLFDLDALERSARAELVALDPALMDDEEWRTTRDNLLRFFALLQVFTELEEEPPTCDIRPEVRDKIRRS